MDAKAAIAEYKAWYKERFGIPPTEKLINRFCEINGIETEKIREPDRKEVEKVEGEYK